MVLRSEEGLVKDDGSKLGRQFADLLEPGEAFVAAATVNTGSIKRAAYGGRSSPIVKLGVTDRRILTFSTSNLGFNLKARKFLEAIPLSEIASVDSSTGRLAAMKALKIQIRLKDGTELAFEASGATFKSAEELAAVLQELVT
jgi:hypothetical protein